MDGSLSLVAVPGVEPITVQDAKDWARITTEDEDDLVRNLTIAARRYVEKVTGRSLITQTWDYFLDCFPCWAIPLPQGTPLQSITSVKYTDQNGTQQTISSTLYTANIRKAPAIVVPSYGNVWPSARTVENAVEIRYVAGYGTDEDVPAELKQAIKVLVSAMYENREPTTDVSAKDVPMAFWNLINEYRLYWL